MARPNTGNAKTDWYQHFTNEIVTSMEKALQDSKEWKKSWEGLWKHGLPHNGSSGRRYNGLNIWILALQGHEDPRWYTYKQAEGLGAQVRKGEKGTKVYFWNFIKVYEDLNGKEVRKPTPEQINSGAVRLVRTIPSLRIYTVFNASQIDGLPEMEIEEVDLGAKYINAQALVEILNIDLKHIKGSGVACYRPGEDSICVPAAGQFETVEHYWATVLHEVVHWTGHKSRLDRDLSGRFGSDAYAMEELVAELGSAFLCAHLGIEGELRHPEYLASWIKRLKSDNRAIFKAATLAQKAVDFIIDGGGVQAEAGEDGVAA